MVSRGQRRWFSRKAKGSLALAGTNLLTVGHPPSALCSFLRTGLHHRSLDLGHAIKITWLQWYFFSFLVTKKTWQTLWLPEKSSGVFWWRQAGATSVWPICQGLGVPHHTGEASQSLSHILSTTSFSFYSHFLHFYFHENPKVWINSNVGIFQESRWVFLFESEVFNYCLRLLFLVIHEFLWNFLNVFNLG